MVERTLEQIEKEIAETKTALQDVHGTETEVYARIVGYYRAVKHWNNGKKDEYNLRKMFTLEDSNNHITSTVSTVYNSVLNEKPAETSSSQVYEPVLETNAVTYELYTKQTCPNCPPVKAFMEKVDLPGRNINVDTTEGLSEAAKKGVFASPTVIFYNEAGIETARCHNVEELEVVLNKVTVLA